MKVKRFVQLAVFLRTAFPCAFLCTFTLLPGTIYAAFVPDGFVDELVADGLFNPTAMTIAPDGRIFVCEQEGTLRLIKNDTLLSTPVLNIFVDPTRERGLLGIALDPDFASNQYIYIYYTAVSPTVHNRVSRFTLSSDVAVPGSETILLELFDLVAEIHNGGALHFGLDGKLYVAVGENANNPLAQNLNTLHGKMLRINKDGSIPTDNPFYDTVSGDNRAIWAYGLRNPFTFAVHSVTGRIFINDVGQNSWEEINDGIPGSNYGWPLGEGPTGNPIFVDPIYYYSHAEGCAITGGTFFSPQNTNFPAHYQGVYFFADLCSSWIRMLDPSQGNNVTVFATDAGNPVDLDVAPDGNLYYLAWGHNALYRIRFSQPTTTTTSTTTSTTTTTTSTTTTTCPPTETSCTNGVDDDCDGLVDCDDPDCEFDLTCLCQCPDDGIKGCISSRVTDRDGNPLANKKVKIKQKGNLGFKDSVRTDRDGCYAFTGLDDGTYKIKATRCRGRGGRKKIVFIQDGAKVHNDVNFECKKRRRRR